MSLLELEVRSDNFDLEMNFLNIIFSYYGHRKSLSIISHSYKCLQSALVWLIGYEPTQVRSFRLWFGMASAQTRHFCKLSFGFAKVVYMLVLLHCIDVTYLKGRNVYVYILNIESSQKYVTYPEIFQKCICFVKYRQVIEQRAPVYYVAFMFFMLPLCYLYSAVYHVAFTLQFIILPFVHFGFYSDYIYFTHIQVCLRGSIRLVFVNHVLLLRLQNQLPKHSS